MTLFLNTRTFTSLALASLLTLGLAAAQNNMPGMDMSNSSTGGTSQGSAAGMNMSSSSMGGMDMTGMQSGLAGLQKLSGKAFDRAFLSMMIPHHQAAVDMSRAVLPKASDVTVKTWANQIIAAQNREISQMNAWLKTLGGTDTAMQGMMKQTMSGMGKMVSSAKDPQRAFVQGMLPHHASAIEMASLALQKSSDARVLGLARDIVRAQATEMHDFRTWLVKRPG